MNKKLIALMIVPIMLTLSGAMAYSAFSGTATTNITANAGDITVNEYAELSGGYSNNTHITVTGGFGSNTAIAYLNNSTVSSPGQNLATVPSTDSGSQYLVYYINISNLAPGNWVKIGMILENKGSVGVVFADPVIGTASFTGSDLNLSNVTGSLHSRDIFTTTTTSGKITGNPLSGVSSLSGSSGYLFATTNNNINIGSSSAAKTGYAFAFGTFASDFEKSITDGGAVDYNFYVGLSAGAGNNYQGSSVSIPIIVGVTSDP